jgi:hypothetical protein
MRTGETWDKMARQSGGMDPIVEALAMLRAQNAMDIEVHRTWQGHWHAGHVPCDDRCPMGHEASRRVFRRELDLAMGGAR